MTYGHKTTRPQVGKSTHDCFAIIPASFLPLREQWRQLVADLPDGDVLIIMPTTAGPLRNALQTLSPTLRARGRHITTFPAEALV